MVGYSCVDNMIHHMVFVHSNMVKENREQGHILAV